MINGNTTPNDQTIFNPNNNSQQSKQLKSNNKKYNNNNKKVTFNKNVEVIKVENYKKYNKLYTFREEEELNDLYEIDNGKEYPEINDNKFRNLRGSINFSSNNFFNGQNEYNNYYNNYNNNYKYKKDEKSDCCCIVF